VPARVVVAHVDAEDLNTERAPTSGGSVEAAPAISAETARRLCCDGYIQLVAQTPDSTVTAISDTHKTIPERLRRIIRYLDGGCRFPGCGRSIFAEIHHLVHRADGGPTTPDNLLWACRYHHMLPHEAGWTITGNPNSELTWTRLDGNPSEPAPTQPTLTCAFVAGRSKLWDVSAALRSGGGRRRSTRITRIALTGASNTAHVTVQEVPGTGDTRAFHPGTGS
jgi:hypothetical protein